MFGFKGVWAVWIESMIKLFVSWEAMRMKLLEEITLGGFFMPAILKRICIPAGQIAEMQSGSIVILEM